MQWRQLCELAGVPSTGPDFAVSGITEDSRRVRPGMVFVAVRGGGHDGHDFVPAAIEAGAVAILGDRADTTEIGGVPYRDVAAPRRALSLIAHALAGNPTGDMNVIGVTGTNGKSSTVTMAQRILQHAGHRAGNFGTLGYDVGDRVIPAPLTTPPAEDLADMFRQARENACEYVAMEVSSHALSQDRAAGIAFDVAAFTNLTQDHLDYHKDMENYLQAKLILFRGLASRQQYAIINQDDPSAPRFVEAAALAQRITYGQKGDIRASKIRLEMRRTLFRLASPWGEGDIEMQILGRHAVWNALCAAGCAGALGIPFDAIAGGLAKLPCVPGRFEHVDAGQDFAVVVDYAHTEDALRNVLAAARSICKKRIIVVFGCGGDRDKTKRPRMGRAALELSDFAVVTSDNPRTEDPHRIILDVEQGVQHAGGKKHDDYAVIEDRAEAIAFAIGIAEPGDLVLIAGKGHEDYQILGTQKIHFDDREVALEILKGRG
ncbi:MAG: UDP-N-acetylmuramoyl-L-alanyl-D-glutamate--2,6-diaminopimelate ligase [Candidatus Hydrogenedentes bacterium]|nr:UDP-N-acetylmuramoyl-L-alanyl-D-glutamate--2,6-diaminopimelate ligase [Candidatus Hydrogenedentota bacterium]